MEFVSALDLMQVDPPPTAKHVDPVRVPERGAGGEEDLRSTRALRKDAVAGVGPDAIAAIRQTMGKTRGTEADPGSIRAALGLQNKKNLTHASDSSENAEIEIALWFKPEELVEWKGCTEDSSY